MGVIALAITGALAFGVPALAQGAAASPGAESADPERVAMAEKLFSAMHLDTTMRGVFANMFKSMANSATDGQTSPRTQELLASYGGALDNAMPELMHQVALSYARVLTTQELKDSLTFYESPSGQAILNKMPQMMAQVVPLTMKLMPKIATSWEADFCAKETCTDADHAMFKRLKGMGGAVAAGGS